MNNLHEIDTKFPKSHSGISYREHNSQGIVDNISLKSDETGWNNVWFGNTGLGIIWKNQKVKKKNEWTENEV